MFGAGDLVRIEAMQVGSDPHIPRHASGQVDPTMAYFEIVELHRVFQNGTLEFNTRILVVVLGS